MNGYRKKINKHAFRKIRKRWENEKIPALSTIFTHSFIIYISIGIPTKGGSTPMTEKESGISRRKFMLVSSAAMAAPFVLDAAATTSAAEAAGIRTTATGDEKTYYIGHECMGCQVCRMKCPAGAIHYGDDRNEIDQSKCEHCGTCYEECPVSVVSEIQKCRDAVRPSRKERNLQWRKK